MAESMIDTRVKPAPPAGVAGFKYWQPPEEEYELMVAHGVTCSMPRQVSGNYSIGIVEHGRADLTIGNQSVQLAGASLMLLEPDKPFARSASTHYPRSVRSITFQPNHFAQLVSEAAGKQLHAPKFTVPIQVNSALTTEFLRIHRQLESADSQVIRARAIGDLAGLLVAHCIDLESPVLPPSDPRIEQVKAFMLANSAQTVSLDELAAMVGLSSCRLNRIFSSSVGVPPHAYLNQIRVWNTMKMLAKGLAIADAASASGFYDQAHFARHFKKLTGFTPGTFQAGRTSG